jgi:hypothetical protein
MNKYFTNDVKKEFWKSKAGILLKDAPYSSELRMQLWDVDICDDPEMEYWTSKSFKEVIKEVEGIAFRYSKGSGWVHAEGIEDGCEIAKRELKELKSVIRHMKKVLKKVK